MKVAICFYGLVGSISDKNGNGKQLDPRLAYDLYKDNIFEHNDVDVFIHSYSTEAKELLVDLYRPKAFLIEKQVAFPKAKNHPFIKKGVITKLQLLLLRIVKRDSYKKMITNLQSSSFRAHSRWYSVMKSVEIMREFEDANEFRYDCVLSTRLDASFFSPVRFSDFDMSFFHASNWNDAPSGEGKMVPANYLNHNVGKGFLDLWFFSNSELMFQFSKLYEHINLYPINPHTSSYRHAISLTDKIEYVFYRWHDHELIRRKFFESAK